MSNYLRHTVLGLALIALPVSTTATVRPSAAIPAAASSLVAQDSGKEIDTWLWIGGGVVLAIILALILFDDDDDDDDDDGLSRG